MKKKLIGFDDELLDKIEVYSAQWSCSFTETVRRLIVFGYTAIEDQIEDTPQEQEQEQGDSVDFPSLVHTVDELSQQIAKLTKDMSWWNADDNQSKVGDLKVQVDTMEKKINVLTSVSKLFKGHIKNREIHLQDG